MKVANFFVAALECFSLASCSDDKARAKLIYTYDLTPDQVVRLRSDLRTYALTRDLAFIDRSIQTNNARSYVNKESIRSSKKNPRLIAHGEEIIDVTVEPRTKGLQFIVFAKTSAYHAEEVSITLIYDKRSEVEREMAEEFLNERFIRKEQ